MPLPQQVSINGLFVYPVKALQGVQVSFLNFTSRGVQDDRRYMLIDSNLRFISQRSHPKLALLSLFQVTSGWQVVSPNGHNVVIPNQHDNVSTMLATIWRDTVSTIEPCAQVSDWFSDYLGMPCQLVELSTHATRVAPQPIKSPLAFADAYPLLVANSQSLNALNDELGLSLSMARFRPNIVISADPHVEFSAESLKFNASATGSIELCEPCVRCNVPSIDPITAEFDAYLHQKMKHVLKREGAVVFGMNALPINLSRIAINSSMTMI